MDRIRGGAALATLAVAAVCGGCIAALAVGAAAGAGVVLYTAEDTVECDIGLMPEGTYEVARKTLEELGTVTETRSWSEDGELRRLARGRVEGVDVTILIRPGAARSHVAVSGRDGLLPAIKIAERILNRIRQRAGA